MTVKTSRLLSPSKVSIVHSWWNHKIHSLMNLQVKRPQILLFFQITMPSRFYCRLFPPLLCSRTVSSRGSRTSNRIKIRVNRLCHFPRSFMQYFFSFSHQTARSWMNGPEASWSPREGLCLLCFQTEVGSNWKICHGFRFMSNDVRCNFLPFVVYCRSNTLLIICGKGTRPFFLLLVA